MNLSRTTYEALGLKIFFTLACRLTGESSTSRRLEIGIARLVDGKISSQQSFSFLLSSVSSSKRRNTARTFLDFIGEDDPILVYDWEAFRSILDESGDPIRISEQRILDVGELARIVFPALDDFRIERIARHLEVQRPIDSTPVSEAEHLAAIFLGLLPEILGLDFPTLDALHRLAAGGMDGLPLFFRNVFLFAKTSLPSRVGKFRIAPRNILGKPTKEETSETAAPLRTEEINEFFDPEGALARLVSNYEKRPQQTALARSVALALNQDEFLLAEAGTGVGKSLAYLVPAVLWTLRDKSRRVLVATHTKTLQDQLFRKEIPLLFEAFDGAFQAVLLKGRSNYLCLRRWESLIARIDSFSQNQRRALLPLVVWVSETRDGDIEENGAFMLDQNSSLWNQINADESHCLKSACPFESRCFVQKARRAAKSANIVVVNHALLFSDFVSSHAIIGPYDTLIVDEAHQFEKIATQHLGALIHRGHFIEVLQDIHSESRKSDTLVHQIEALTSRIADPEANQRIRDRLDTVKRSTLDFIQQTVQYFQILALTLQSHFPESQKQKVRFRENPFQKWMPEETSSLIERLEHLAQLVTGTVQLALNEAGSTTGSALLETESLQILERLVSLRRRIDHFYTSDYHENVVWSEPGLRGEDGVRFYSVPLEVSSLLATQLYSTLSRCIMTSATLTVGGRFDYMVSRLGLDQIESERLVAQPFGSPFAYAEQAMILFPTFLPSPKESDFVPAITTLIHRILETHHRGALVLFTSYQMLQDVYEGVKTLSGDSGFVLMAQGIDGSRSSLLKRFQEIPDSVLFGTNSFWEGVDVPGAALELLIITKIPFDVPTEPVVEARYEYAELQTGSGFLNYAVPEAIIRFKQGFGRLIRSGSDRGAILLFDRRAVSTQYGRLLVDSLPAEPILPNSEDELLSQLQEWFQEVHSDRQSAVSGKQVQDR